MSAINWHGAINRRKQVERIIAESEHDGDWTRAARYAAERDRIPHPGWLRTEPYTPRDVERVRAAHPDWFRERVNPWTAAA